MQNTNEGSSTTKESRLDTNDCYLMLADSSHEIFYKLRIDGYFTFISPACKHLMGYRVGDLEGHLFQEFIHPDDQSFFNESLKKFSQSPEPNLNIEFRVRHLNGEWRVYSSDMMTLTNCLGTVIGFSGVARDITEAIRIERELRESEQKYRSLFENMTTGFALMRLVPDSDKRTVTAYFQEVNPAFEHLLSLRSEDVIGHPVTEILPDIEQHWLDACVGVSNGESPLFVELYSKSRKRYFVVRVFSPGKEQFAVTFVDETERKQKELQILKLSEAVKQSAASIVITDLTGNIEYVNPRFTEVTGYSSEESIGQNPRILKSGEQSSDFYKELWDTILSGNTWKGEFRNVKKNGEFYWEVASIAPIKSMEGVITHFVAVKDDITERKMMEAELVIAKEAAEESERLKSAFLANMSHEIRTPMNGILGFADLLKGVMLSREEQNEYIDIIETSGRRMLSIINDLIDISKVESGQMKLTLSDTNINDQLCFINNFFKLEVKQKGLEISYHCPLETDLAVIHTDREKLYAVLTNLVKNAIKFTLKGSISFGYVVKDQMVEFYCKDTGRGIPADKLTAVFERFQQVDTHLSNGIEGSGLGLAISKAYVEMLGGTLWVESEIGVGSTFFFTLPYKSIRNSDSKEEKTIYTLSGECKMDSSATILIAEDDPAGLKYLTELLKKYDFKVLVAENGEDAVQLCYGNEDIKMVLMDIKIPVMDGYTAAQVIKGFRSDLPIIAETALAMEKEKYKDVFDDYLVKPIKASDIEEVVCKYLGKKLS